MNLRPPGPQAAGWGVARLSRPVYVDVRVLECVPVALRLFPSLLPKRGPVAAALGRLVRVAPGRPQPKLQKHSQKSPTPALIIGRSLVRVQAGPFRCRYLQRSCCKGACSDVRSLGSGTGGRQSGVVVAVSRGRCGGALGSSRFNVEARARIHVSETLAPRPLRASAGRPSKVLLRYRRVLVENTSDRRAGEIRLFHADRHSAPPAPDRAHRSCRRSG